MTVSDIGCASSIVRAKRFRTVAKSFTAGAHTPAVMIGHSVVGTAVSTVAELVVMRGCESRAGLRHVLGWLAVRVARGRWVPARARPVPDGGWLISGYL